MLVDTSKVAIVSVVGDPQALYRVVLNLLSNAFKYGSTGGTIEIILERDGPSASLTVKDDGPGIPEEALPFVFERFFRADSSDSQQSTGTGLGLAIVKAIVEAHNSEVRVSSKKGQGAEFAIILPPIPRDHQVLESLESRS